VNRRKWLFSALASIPVLTIAIKGQEIGKATDTLCKTVADESHKYSIYSVEGGKVLNADARFKWAVHYQKLIEKFAAKASEFNKLLEKVKNPKLEEERQLWVDAMMAAIQCKENVERLQKLYD